MKLDDTEKYILQTIYGIIPKDLWSLNKESAITPFKGFSAEQERIAKRKFRKLKRKAGIKPWDKTANMWRKINRYLEKYRL